MATPKATNLHKLRGTYRPDRERGVQASRAIPRPPTHLSREAKAEWNRVTPELFRLGLVSNLDRSLLSICCSSWSDWVAARKILTEEGLLSAGRNRQGKAKVRHPAALVARQAAADFSSAAKELGLTPRARQGLDPTMVLEDDSLLD